MSQQPKTETDRLANVIQVLQLGQKTGRLVVERNNGQFFEQGIVTFISGQIVQASTGQRQGQDALAWLGSWGPCRFSFSIEQRPGYTGHMTAFPPQRHSQGETTYSTSHHTSPLTNTSPVSTSGQYAIFSRTTGKLGGSGSFPLTQWMSTPFRTRYMEEGMHLIEQMGLSRAHRRLFLLIDGRRTPQELVRLMAQDPAEVYRLLKDLERAGVVQS
ncbi:MAG TPA: DUF4388 domain-containing protein [Ktedonobacteraceae bacterium]|nr:DUF4388 domain-containing protein [Ktedonobacteraceae bacterium]